MNIMDRKGTAKLNELLAIEETVQKQWEEAKVFEVNADDQK